jgi:hypothetical protein
MSAQGPASRNDALQFRDIDIVRIVGIRHPFRLDRLSPGINLIHGPNGIGKTRTAHALQALIWPATSSGRAEIGGSLEHGDDRWRVDLDHGTTRYQRNGVPETSRVLTATSADHRDRYLLTLTDLLHADNREFARAIAREAAGGYDLENARNEMGIATAFSRPRKHVRELQEAEDTVATLRREDQALQQEERTLETLRVELDEAIAAYERTRLLELARAHSDALAELSERRFALEAFPEPVRRMTGDEYETARELQSQLSEARSRHEHAIRSIEQRTEERAATGFADTPVPHTLIFTLRDRLNIAQRAVSGIEQAERERGQASRRLDEARQRLAAGITDEQLATLDSDGLREFSSHLNEKRDIEGAVELQERIRDWLGEVERPGDIELLRSGVAILQQYLGTVRTQASEQEGQHRWFLLGAATIIILEAIGLAITASVWLLLLALPAFPLIMLALRQHSGPDDRAWHLREEFTRLGLAPPESWIADQVQDRLAELQREVSNVTLEEEKFHRWHGLVSKRQETETRLRILEHKQLELLETYGDIAQFLEPISLRQIADSLEKWRRAQDELADAQTSLSLATQLLEKTLAEINTDIQTVGGGSVTDVSQASAAIEELATRATTAEKLTASITESRHRLADELQPEVARQEQELSEMYASLGLATDDDAGLKRLCDLVNDYMVAHKALNDAEVIVRTRRTELRDDPDLLELSREQIERSLADAEMAASQRERLQTRIVEIETKARQARRETRLEDAIASEAQARDELADRRQREYEDVSTRNLFAFVEDRNEQLNRPVVLQIADRYFTRFTSGAYTLSAGKGQNADLLAIDTTTGRALALDQLSSGTRIHLLLAVRLAFVEVSEQGTQLPVILDEVLGNTDDERATAIIDAAIEIARQGRQVLYFTAQQDEIGKWLARLNAHDDPPASHVIDLEAARFSAQMKAPSKFEWDGSIFARDPIDPSATHDELRKLLSVPPIDFWADTITGYHVWYFITSPESLAQLHERGIRTWGQYRELAQRNYLRDIEAITTSASIHARARVIETVCREWRFGRPRPLTTACLHESNLITDRFRDEVVNCAASHDWDGSALVTALRNREISGFYQATIEKLEDWFRDHGYVVDSEPLDDAMIRAAAISAGADAIRRGVLDEFEIDSLLMCMTGAPIAAPAEPATASAL